MTETSNLQWRRAAIAGASYVAVVFAAGFVFGVIRTLVLMPRVGETTAVLIELPFLLAVSWLASARITLRFDVPATSSHRITMGLVAFALLMLAEAALSSLVFGRTLADHVALYRQTAHLLGLTGQVLFAIIPWLQTRR